MQGDEVLEPTKLKEALPTPRRHAFDTPATDVSIFHRRHTFPDPLWQTCLKYLLAPDRYTTRAYSHILYKVYTQVSELTSFFSSSYLL